MAAGPGQGLSVLEAGPSSDCATHASSEYAARQLAVMLGRRVPAPPALLDRLARALTRDEEDGASPDGHGNFAARDSELWADGRLEAPPLDDEIAQLASEQPELPPRWPGGRRFAALLSHDVDRVVSLPWRERFRQISAVGRQVGLLQRTRWRGAGALWALQTRRGAADRAPFDSWIAEESRYGFHSTFFLLPEHLAAPTLHDHFYRYGDSVVHGGRELPLRDAVRRTREEGWEIGLHGSYASAYDASILAGERAQVEAAAGAPVTSIRQHYLRFSASRTPQMQSDAGLRADSTLGYSSTIGLRAGTSLPFFWERAPDLLEVPLAIQDVGLLRIYGKDVDVPSSIARGQALIRRIAATGGVATLSWHTHAESPGAMEAYRALLATVAEEGGWGCSLGELEGWWRERAAAVAAAS
jgi:peptidoglycan/xylan/chitin deacetylase (PgdA/CDA1 family)